MRVIAGEKGGRRLTAPPGRGTRPTSDRVREAAFSMLESLDVIEGAKAWDLFAGSGAMGIEALSRGAAEVTFVDNAGPALLATRANLDQLGYGPPAAVVVRADAPAWVAARAGHVDLVFADPPYAWGQWEGLLASLAAHEPLVLIETAFELVLPELWSVVKTRRYGGTVVTLARHRAGDDA